MKKVAVVLVLALASMAATCPPKPQPACDPATKPAPDCTCKDGKWECPPPPDTGTKFDELLLSRQGPTIVDAEGKPFDFRGHASCCTSEEGEPDPAWALATDEHLDRMKALGFNVVHWRLGPYRALPDSPESLRQTGGPYADDGTRADLTRWNEPFWAYLRGRLEHAGALRMRVEIDDVDGWGCKPFGGQDEEEGQRALLAMLSARTAEEAQAQWLLASTRGTSPFSVPGYHPWKAANNLQGEDWITNCGTGEIAPGSVYDLWVRKLFRETLPYSNTMHHDGNEIDLVRGYSPAWTASIGNILRDEESKLKTKRHLFGSNAPQAATATQVDYITIHSGLAPTEADRRGTDKPVLNNEYNPWPAFQPAQVKALFCEARNNGTYLWYWRHSQSKAQFEETARLLQVPCPTVSGCSKIPNEDAIKVEPRPAAKYSEQINKVHLALNPMCASALAAYQARLKRQAVSGVVETEGVGERCDIPMQANVYRAVFAQKAREMFPELCTGIQTDSEGPVDECSMGSPQEVQNYHVFACKTATCPPEHPDCGCDSGTVAWAPGSVRDTWRSPATTSCLPAPRLGKFEVKNAGINRVVVDATPKTCADQDWNRRCSTGNTCSPGGAEGNPDRLTIEAQWGPYGWTVDGAACAVCFLDGGNPLRLVAPGQVGKTIRVTGGNGVFAEIVGAHP